MRLLVVIFLLTYGIASGQSQQAKEVDHLHRKKFDWLINKNYDSLNWLMDAQVKYIHSNGWIQSKQEVIDDLKSGKLNYTNVTIESAEVLLYSNSAVVTGKGSFKGLMPNGTEFSLRLLYTEVYVKIKKQWKLVSRLATRLP